MKLPLRMISIFRACPSFRFADTRVAPLRARCSLGISAFGLIPASLRSAALQAAHAGKALIFVLSLAIPVALSAQTPKLSNHGGLISVKSGALLSVRGDVINHPNGTIHNTDTIAVTGDWTNNGNNPAFISPQTGIVELLGADQHIDGTSITRFYDLRLEGSGIKYGDLDVEVNGFLRLNDREMSMANNTVKVFNPAVNAVSTNLNGTFGFVSSILMGGLQRNVDASGTYVFPVGSSLNLPRFRPISMILPNSGPSVFKVRHAEADATSESYDRSMREQLLCLVNPEYYHRIYRISGTQQPYIRYHYDAATDGDWQRIVHWRGLPYWEIPFWSAPGFDNTFQLDYLQSAQTYNTFTYPAFALGTVNDSLTMQVSANPSCPGDTVTFIASGDYDLYNFYVNDTMRQSQPDSVFYWVPREGDVVRVFGIIDECVAFSFLDTMHIFQNTITLSASPIPACDYDPIVFTGTPGFQQYDFMVNGSVVQSGPASTFTSDSLNTGDIVTVMGFDGNCDWLSNALTVQLYTNQAVLTASSDSVCAGGNLVFNANAGFNQYQYFVNGVSVQNSTSPTLTYGPFQEGDIVSLTATDAFCSYASNQLIIHLYTNTVNLTHLPDTACAGSAVVFTASPGFQQYNFYLNGNLVQSGAVRNYVSTAFQNGDIVQVSATDIHCTYQSNLDTIHIYQNSIGVTASAAVVCPNDPVTFTASPGFVNYNFFFNGQSAQNSASPTYIHSGFNGNDTVYVVGSDIHCPYVSNFVVVNIFQSSFSFTVSDTAICTGDPITITATPGYQNYNYYVNGVSVSQSTSNTYTASFNNNDLVYVEGTDLVCTWPTPPVPITVYSASVNLLLSDTLLCEGLPFTATATPEFEDYTFVFNGDIWSTQTTPVLDSFLMTPISGYVEVTDIHGCQYASDTVSLNMNPGVAVNIWSDTLIYTTTSAILQTTGSSNITSYNWYPSNTLDCNNCPVVIANPLETTLYTLLVQSADGCTGIDSALVRVDAISADSLVIPNCITPNGDGANDTWVIDFISLFTSHEVVLINRWGNEVFRSNFYENDFDGSYDGGKLPAGVYYYIIRLNGNRVYKGPFTIIRE